MNRHHSVIFEIASKYCISDSFVDYDGYSISSKGFLPTVVEWSSQLNPPIPVHFSLLTPRMLAFTLAISCLCTSNLSWFMDLTFQVPMQYCSLQHQTLLLSPGTSTTVYFCFGSLPSFFLELFLHWSPVAYWAPANLGSFSFSILSFGLFILFMGFSRQEYWSGLAFGSPVDHTLSDLSTMTWLSWWPHTAWLSFTELDKAVVLWSDWLVFCDYGFSLSALWCPLSVPTVLLRILLPWTWGISSWLLQQSTTTAPYLGRVISSRPPLLTLNVEKLLSALLHPRSHGSLDVGLPSLATAPDLGRGA